LATSRLAANTSFIGTKFQPYKYNHTSSTCMLTGHHYCVLNSSSTEACRTTRGTLQELHQLAQ
jgi:hypothetical protein